MALLPNNVTLHWFSNLVICSLCAEGSSLVFMWMREIIAFWLLFLTLRFLIFLVLFLQCRRHLLHSFLYVMRWMKRAETGDISEHVGVDCPGIALLCQVLNKHNLVVPFPRAAGGWYVEHFPSKISSSEGSFRANCLWELGEIQSGGKVH